MIVKLCKIGEEYCVIDLSNGKNLAVTSSPDRCWVVMMAIKGGADLLIIDSSFKEEDL